MHLAQPLMHLQQAMQPPTHDMDFGLCLGSMWMQPAELFGFRHAHHIPLHF
jgi:hypothetical protein